MIGTLYIDDLDGAVTLFKSTDEGTETIAAFDEEYREVLQDLLTEIKRLSDELDNERNADSGSVSNERIWEQIDRNDRLAAQRVRERLDIEVKETEGEGGYVKYPDPGCGLDSETGRFDMENYEWVNPPERLWLDAVEAEVKRLRGILGDITAIYEWGGDGKDVGITITYSEGDSFMGWLNKCDDEVIE